MKNLSRSAAAAAVTIACLLASTAFAKDPPKQAVRLSVTQGEVSIRPAAAGDWGWAAVNRPLSLGDKLWTQAKSRAELRFGPNAVRADQNTSVALLNNDDGLMQIGLASGTIIAHLSDLPKDGHIEIDTPNVAVTIDKPGDYRIHADDSGDFTAVDVRQGGADVTGNNVAIGVPEKTEAQITGTDNLKVSLYDLPAPDDFDKWSKARDERALHARTAKYVSSRVTGYEELDTGGKWVHDVKYGEVWQPVSVARDWSPYRDGRWAWVDPWGWTWIDDQPWGYATSHYGRWVNASSTGGWAWVPPPREAEVEPVYSPANVVFVNGAPARDTAELVSWVPLAPGEAYIPACAGCSDDYIASLNRGNTVFVTQGEDWRTREMAVRDYQNVSATGAIVAVAADVLANARPVATSVVAVSPATITTAKVVTVAPVVPTVTAALAQPANKASAAPKPADAVAARTVVAKETPPAPPASIGEKQDALKKDPGKPVAAEASASTSVPAVKTITASETKPAATVQKKQRPGNARGYSRIEPSAGTPAMNATPTEKAAPASATPAATPSPENATSTNATTTEPVSPREQAQQRRQQEQEERKAAKEQAEQQRQQDLEQKKAAKEQTEQQRKQDLEQKKAEKQQDLDKMKAEKQQTEEQRQQELQQKKAEKEQNLDQKKAEKQQADQQRQQDLDKMKAEKQQTEEQRQQELQQKKAERQQELDKKKAEKEQAREQRRKNGRKENAVEPASGDKPAPAEKTDEKQQEPVGE